MLLLFTVMATKGRMLRRFWPDTMLRQVMVLMVLAGIIMMISSAVAMHFVRLALENNLSVMNSHLVSIAVTKLNETPADQRAAVLEELRKEDPFLKISFVDESDLKKAVDEKGPRETGPFRLGDTLLGMRVEHIQFYRELGNWAPPELYIRLRDGNLILTQWGFRGPPPPVFGISFYLFTGFLVLSVIALMVWAARSVAAPIADLASSASKFGETSTDPVLVKEKGPKEVRIAAQAFNRMQLRIHEFLERRTRTLAAISHDLRTPLTRLRLRLDLLEDGDIRDRSLEDLKVMDRQITAALTFLRDGGSSEPVLRIDVPSLLQSLVDQYQDLGFSIELRCRGRFSVRARKGEFERALSNLIENANQYANGVEIEAAAGNGRIRIDVIDHGPGIPAPDRSRLLEPFERGDDARQIRKDTGFGLGLATTKAIVEAAGGTLLLLETPGGGLTVRLAFPVASKSAEKGIFSGSGAL